KERTTLAAAPVFELSEIRFERNTFRVDDPDRILKVCFLGPGLAERSVAAAMARVAAPVGAEVRVLLGDDARFAAYAAILPRLHEAQQQLAELEGQQAPTRARIARERQALQEDPGQAAAEIGRRLAELDGEETGLGRAAENLRAGLAVLQQKVAGLRP